MSARRNPFWVSQKNAADNATAAVSTLLHLLGVQVTLSSVRSELASHPRAPSLLAVSDALASWGVSSQAMRGSPEQLAAVSFPALAHLSTDRGRFAVITSVDDGLVVYLDPARGPVSEPLEDFAKQWSGALLIPAALPGAGEPFYASQRRAERRDELRVPLLAVLVALCILVTGIALPERSGPVDAFWLALLCLKGLGLLASGLLVAITISGKGDLARKVCRHGRVVNCSSVLSSRAAALAGVPVADLGMLYFLGGAVALGAGWLAGSEASAWAMLRGLNWLALPYSLFSIFYQAFIVRRWCWLCVAVQALIGLEFAVLATGPGGVDAVQREWIGGGWALWSAAFAVPAVLWGLIRPSLVQHATAARHALELESYRRNPAVARDLLGRGARSEMGKFEAEIAEGSIESPISIVAVAHPGCGYCAATHTQLARLVAGSRGTVRCTTRFFVDPNDDPAAVAVAEHALGLALADSEHAASQALAAWFQNPDQPADVWRARFAIAGSLDPAAPRALLAAQRAWAKAIHLGGVPAVFVQGRAWPRELGLGSLGVFIRTEVRQHLAARANQS